MLTDTSSHEGQEPEHEEAIDPVLGRCLHVYEAKAKARDKGGSRRQLEILGVLAVLMVPISLVFVKGTTGTVLAVFGALVAALAYFLSGRKPVVRTTTIKVHERGVVCAESDAKRDVLWNEVVDVKTKRMPLPNGRTSVAVVLEVVAAPPLLFVVTGNFTEKDRAGRLIEALSSVWLPVWCRRAKVMLENGYDVEVGSVRLHANGFSLGDKQLSWSEVQGLDALDSSTALVTAQGKTNVEESALIVPFPSTAQRLASLASSPPDRPLLPPARR